MLPLPSLLLRYIKVRLSPLFQNNRQLERQESILGEREVAHSSIGTRSLGTPQLCSQGLHSPALAVGITEKHMRGGWVCISWFLHSCLSSEAAGFHFKLQHCKKCVPLAKQSNSQGLIHMHMVPGNSRKSNLPRLWMSDVGVEVPEPR